MKGKTGIIDYGMSNLLSISRAVEFIGGEVIIIDDKSKFNAVSRIILPGVGAFPKGIYELMIRGFVKEITSNCRLGMPFLGICLGMQMMLSIGFEDQPTEGLDLIKGEVLSLTRKNSGNVKDKVPNVGWRGIYNSSNTFGSPLLNETKQGDLMYFVHSFYVQPEEQSIVSAWTNFGDTKFASVIQKENCFGTQFHPEKSGEKGLTLLKKFIELK